MTQKLINVGEGANSGTGDSIRDAFVKVNDNFNELYFNGVSNNVQEFITKLNTATYISTTTMNVLANLFYTSTATLTTRVGVVETKASTLTNRVTVLEGIVSKGLVDAGTNLDAAARGLVISLNTLTNTVTNLTTRVSNIETSVTVLTTTVTNISTALDTLTTTATNLATRIGIAEASLVPRGVIMMWSGAASAVPTGYVICDGTNSAPDLRDRFVVGAGNSYAVGATGGSTDASVVSHTHTAALSGSTNSAGSHSHSINDPGHVHNYNSPFQTDVGGPISLNDRMPDASRNTDSAQTGITINAAGDHSHTVSVSGTTDSTGGTATNANLPPYYALCYIMKT